ncbi:MAG: hypothetical protein KTR31_17545 [Myxococcales bacterium]|nr:hypothetical protein [Myxococcales bacterium]
MGPWWWMLVGCTRVHTLTAGGLFTFDTSDTGEPTEAESCLAPYDRACPPDSELTWGNFGRRFFVDHCMRCHSSTFDDESVPTDPSDLHFEPVNRIRRLTSRIYEVAADDNRRMPPDRHAPVSPAKREDLGDWLACCVPGLPE